MGDTPPASKGRARRASRMLTQAWSCTLYRHSTITSFSTTNHRCLPHRSPHRITIHPPHTVHARLISTSKEVRFTRSHLNHIHIKSGIGTIRRHNHSRRQCSHTSRLHILTDRASCTRTDQCNFRLLRRAPRLRVRHVRHLRSHWLFPRQLGMLGASPSLWSCLAPSPGRTVNHRSATIISWYTLPTSVQHCHPQLYSITSPGPLPLLELHHYIALSTAVFVPLHPLLPLNRLLLVALSQVISLLLDPPTHTYSFSLSYPIRYEFSTAVCDSPSMSMYFSIALRGYL